MNRYRSSFSAILCLILFTACQPSGEQKSNVRQGKTKIVVDETFRPIIELELDAFQKQSGGQAQIEAIYTDETEAMRLFMADSAQLALVPRKLTEKESKYFLQEKQYNARSTWFAVDGIVLITHKDHKDIVLSLEQLKDVLTGKIKTWAEIDPKLGKEAIQVVFDRNNSSLVRYVADSILKGQKPASNIYAAKSNPGVIEYVKQNKNTLGFIGFNWISQTADPKVDSLTKQVNQVAILNPENNKPYDLAKDVIYRLTYDRYPLKRNLFIHNREPRTGVATGLSAFLAGKEGQLIAYKANLIPASGMIRLVEMKEQKPPTVTKD